MNTQTRLMPYIFSTIFLFTCATDLFAAPLWAQVLDNLVAQQAQEAAQKSQADAEQARKKLVEDAATAEKVRVENAAAAEKARIAALPQTQTWEDPATTLIWTRCPYGYKATETGKCAEADSLGLRSFHWERAMLIAEKLNYLGFNDWRIPTRTELATIILRDCAKKTDGQMSCGDNPNAPATLILNPNMGSDAFGFWTSTLGADGKGLDAVKKITQQKIAQQYQDSSASSGLTYLFTPGVGFFTETWGGNILLVRGGLVSQEYKETLAFAKSDIARLEEAKAAAQAKYDKSIEDAKLAKSQRDMQMAQATDLFRKHLKPGDKSTRGLVLAVKGDLVRIQTYGKQSCSSYQSGTYKCLSLQTVAPSEEWIRRDEIFPAQ